MANNCSALESLIPESYLFGDDYQRAITERWNTTKKKPKRQRKDDNIESKKSNKRQKINEDESIEITTKTSIPTKKNANINNGMFGPNVTKVEELASYISLDENFNYILDQDKSKFLITRKKKKKNTKENDNHNKKFTDDIMSLFDCESSQSNNNSGNSDECNTQEVNLDVDDFMNINMQQDDNESQEDEEEYIECDECFFCTVGNTSHDEIYAKHLNKLKQIYIENRMRCRDEDLAKMLVLYYNEHIYNKNSDENLPILTEEMALSHIKNRGYTHTLNASEHIISSLKSWRKIFDCIASVVFTSDKQIDNKNFNALHKCQLIMNSLFGTNMKKLNFNDPDTNISYTGSLFQRTLLPPNDEKIRKINRQTKRNLTEDRSLYHMATSQY
jgi:hypothetical protein